MNLSEWAAQWWIKFSVDEFEVMHVDSPLTISTQERDLGITEASSLRARLPLKR